MKKISVLLALALLLGGCATFQHSESIDVDRYGAIGRYQDSRTGKLHMFTLAAGGGGGGQATGLGGFLASFVSNQSQSDPRNFARAITLIDFSKKLKYVKYDEASGLTEYEFIQPLADTGVRPKSEVPPPPSFGRQPVQ